MGGIKGETRSLDYNLYNPQYNPSFHFMFHVLFHLLLHYWGDNIAHIYLFYRLQRPQRLSVFVLSCPHTEDATQARV